MSERIITLFGEELVPEQIKAVGRSRAKKKPEEKKAEDTEQVPQAATVATTVERVSQEAAVASPAPEEKTEAPAEEPVADEAESFDLPEDWKGDKHYYSIGEVAALFKVKTSHIRFWTNEFKLKVRTTRKGDRLYTPAQVRELRAIHHLVKERKFTLTGAKAKLKTQNNRDVETIDLKTALLQLRNKLLIIRNKL